MQKILSTDQIEAFHHDNFVENQVAHFVSLCGVNGEHRNVLDMGGGCGYFAKRLMGLANYKVKVVDMDPASVDVCRNSNIEATQGDAVNPQLSGDEDVVSFNLILHHLVASSELDTIHLQTKALAVWVPHVKYLFINLLSIINRFKP